ncbi:MAG: MarR family transcriptional regulator [Oscillospiraceae bacterium]|jgi:predicted transcriptional regulator|nr:MarR family transcriptional regulator [Oscillospiraceae bacterium]
MKELFRTEEIVKLCHALNSEIRVDMLQDIYRNKGISLAELADRFHISKAAVTQNIKILAKANLIELKNTPGKHGQRKTCYLKENGFIIRLKIDFDPNDMYEAEIPIGQYTDYKVLPTCGIATTQSMIGTEDDPRYFDAPSRTQAGILWMRQGYVEYRLPNYLKENQRPIEIQLSMELSSEAPGFAENWPSDIYFYLNGTELGHWTSPGDFGATQGLYTPPWWNINWNQYGLLKLLSINQRGTFLDGLMISPVTIDSLKLHYKSELKFRLAIPDNARNRGGMTIFGNGFGNYDQGIKLRVIYRETPGEPKHGLKPADLPPNI